MAQIQVFQCLTVRKRQGTRSKNKTTKNFRLARRPHVNSCAVFGARTWIALVKGQSINLSLSPSPESNILRLKKKKNV